ncbi:hypothetical protein LINPERHAP1_LOCUS7672 [Linum perenne]
MWKPIGHMHIVDLDKSCFIVKFGLEQDYFKALTGGPWSILDHYLVVHQWDHSFRVSEDLPKKMVVWVRFPHLPIHLYHAQVLTSLGNLIGKTIRIDFNTQRAERGKFARLAVEIDLTEPLPPVIGLDEVTQAVEYENLPTLCFSCGRIGHDKLECPLKSDGSRPMLLPDASVGQVIEGSPVAKTSSETYGPWMIVNRKPYKPRKETSSLKEGADVAITTKSPVSAPGQEKSSLRNSANSAENIIIQDSPESISKKDSADKESILGDVSVSQRKDSMGEACSQKSDGPKRAGTRAKSTAKPNRKKRQRKRVAKEDSPSANEDSTTDKHEGSTPVPQIPSASHFDTPQKEVTTANPLFGNVPKIVQSDHGPPEETPSVAKRFRKSPSGKLDGANLKLKPLQTIGRNSSSGLSKGATKSAIADDLKRKEGEGATLMVVDSVGQDKVGVVGTTVAETEEVLPESSERGWDLNCPDLI